MNENLKAVDRRVRLYLCSPNKDLFNTSAVYLNTTLGRIHKEKNMLMLAQFEYAYACTSIHKKQPKPITLRAEAYPYVRIKVNLLFIKDTLHFK